MKKSDLLKTSALLIIPALSMLVVLYATRFFIGVSPDSTFYVSAAEYLGEYGEIRSIYEGSQMEYMTHYPPGYSVMLCTLNFVVGDIYETARWLNGLFLFGFLASIAFALRNKIALVFILIIQAFVLVNVSLFQVYEMAWTEPAYLFFCFIGLYGLYRFMVQDKKQMKWLVISAAAIAIACITRYVGITLVLTAALMIWNTMRSQPLLIRIRYVFIHGLISCSLIILWMLRNLLLVNNPTDRHFDFHPMGRQYYEDWLISTKQFFLPTGMTQQAELLTGCLIFVLLLVFAIITWRKKKKNLSSIWLTYAFIYLGFLGFSNTFLDYTPMYFRSLSPAYVFILMALLFELASYKKIRALFIAGLMGLLLLVHLRQFAYHVSHINGGRDLSAPNMQLPETIQAINNIPPDERIFTNAVDRLYFMTRGRTSDWLTIWSPSEQGYEVLFNYVSYDDHLLLTSSVRYETVYQSDDVLIRRKMDNNGIE